MSTWWDRIKDPECKLCSLHESATRVCSATGRGHLRARVMFVGESPNEADEMRGMPFMGKAGHLLIQLLEDAEWDIPYTVTTAVCCRIPDKKKAPSVVQTRTCSERYLHRSIRQQAPALIVCLGLTALKGVLNDSSLTLQKSRRRIFHLETKVRNKGRARDTTIKRRSIPVVCTYHPNAVLRDPSRRKIVHEDLRQFLRVLAGKAVEEQPRDRIYKWQGEDEDLPWDLSAGHTFASDLETTGLQPHSADARILSCAASQAPLHAHAFMFGDNLPTRRYRDALSKLDTTKVFHKAIFDLAWLKKWGFKVQGKIFCTKYAFHLLDESYPDSGLQHLARLYTPMGDYAPGKDKRTKKGYDGEDEDVMLADNCGDADATYRLHLLFEPRLKREKLERAFHLGMRTTRTLVDIQYNGAFIDSDALDLIADETDKKVKRVRRWLEREYPDTNFGSTQQVSKILYEDFRIRPGRRTDTGQPSTDERALVLLQDRITDPYQKKFIRGIQELRTQNKLLNTYITPLRDRHILPDGMTHFMYDNTSSVSRLANPFFQVIPKDFRRMFTSRFGNDGVIVQADFSQMELRVLAHLSQEPRLMDAFENGRDVHVETAAELFDKPSRNVSAEERTTAKTLNFAIVYGATAYAIAHTTGMGVNEAERFREKYLARLPKVNSYIKKVKREVLLHGYVRSMFGRKRRLAIDDPDSKEGAHALRQAGNFPIQESASGINLLCMNDIHAILRRGMRSVIIGTVHDSVIFDCLKDEVDEVMMITEEICESANTSQYGFELTVPLKVDIAFGSNWRDLKELPSGA